MGKSSDWKLKVKVPCSRCNESGREAQLAPNTYFVCQLCSGTGKVIVEVEPKDIEEFRGVPESKKYTCVCGESEIILRPKLDQLPNGWVLWTGYMLCPKCRVAMLQNALMAAADKIQQIKEMQDEQMESNMAN